MAPPALTPTSRLRRAAFAERDELGRHRRRLLTTREELREELARIEAALRELDERDGLLDRLVGPPREATPAPTPVPLAAPAGTLRGPAIRRAAVEVLLAHPDRPEALHYREWFAAVCAAGYEIAGKDPLAVFLTQLSRSPVIRKGTRAGVYELDPSAPQRLRARLARLQQELRALTSASGDLAAVRARRAELTAELSRTERAVEEAEAVLGGSTAQPPRLAATS